MQWNRLSLFLKYGYPLDLVNLSLFKHEIPLQQILQLPPQRGVLMLSLFWWKILVRRRDGTNDFIYLGGFKLIIFRLS